MKSRFLKVCSLVIIMALLVQLLPLQVLALEANEEETPIISTEPIPQDNSPGAEKVTPNEPATILGENTSKRTEFSKEYRLSNGLNLAVVYPDAVHYQKDGQWEDIDTTLTVKDGVYTTAASPMKVSFPQQLSNSNTVTVELNGYAVSFGMAGELRGSADGKITTSEMGRESAEMTVTQMQTSTAQLQTFDYSAEKAATEYPETVPETLKSRMVYSNVYSNTNVVYDLTGYKLKESVVIARYDSELQGYSYTLDTGKLIPVLNEDNSISLIDPTTKEAVLNMPAPYMIDYDGEISNDVEVMLIPNGTTYALMYRLPAQWLAAEDRSWPVVLDPEIEATISWRNILDTCASEQQVFNNNVGCMYIGRDSGYGAIRSYIRYTVLPELSSSDVIVDAKLSMQHYNSSGTTDVIEAHAILQEWNVKNITWSNKPITEEKIADYALVNTNGEYSWNITHVVREWYAGNNYGIMFKALDSVENSSTYRWHKFYSVDWDQSNEDDNPTAPRLEITFRNTNGLESYWDYTTFSAGRAGTGYVNSYSGNLVWVHNDIGFGGNRMPVSISHIYNTNDAVPILNSDSVQINNTNPFGLGNGWRTNYNQTVSVYTEDTDYYVWDDADGTKHYFYYDTEDGNWQDEDNLNLTMEIVEVAQLNNPKYTIKDQLGNQNIFDGYGRLIKIQNNQLVSSSIDITYENSTSKRITKITDGVGRVYDFTYTNGLLTRISYTGTGTTELAYVRFEYSGNNLFKIIDQDGKTVQYTYYNSSLLTCKDIDGYLITFEYCGTYPKRLYDAFAYKGTEAGGSLTFEYAHNQTTITDHNGNVNILQFNDWGNVVSIQDGEGRAQYAQYAKNDYQTDKDSSNRANQMILSSKMQNTVNNQLMYANYERNNLWKTNSTTVTMARSKDTAYMGEYSLKVTSTVANNSYGVYSEKVTVKPGETITFSAYVKATGTPVQLAFHCNNYEGYNFITRGEEMQPTGGWERMEVSYTNTTNVTLKMNAYLFCKTAGTAYMDCVQAEIAPTPSRYNLLQNGDFTAIGYWSTSAGRVSLASGEETAAPNLNSYVYKFTGSPTATNTISQSVTVFGNEGDTFILGGWAKGDSVPLTDGNRKFGLRLRFHYTDDTISETSVSFNPATGSENKWQFASLPAVADKAYKAVTVYLDYNYNCNTAYFDGIQLFKEEFGSSYTYDENGRLQSVVDLQSKKTGYIYNENNELLKIVYGDKNDEIENMPEKMTYTYDEEGYHNVMTATSAEGVVYEFDYDDYGNNTLVSIVNGDTTITSTATYTPDGNSLASTTDALGKVTTYGYNPDTGVLEWVQYPEDTEATRTEYTYDNMYRLATVAADIDANTTLTASYTYNNDLLTRLTTGSTTYSFTYNNFGQRTSVKIGTRNLANYTYSDDQNHYLSQLVYGNQDMVQYTYDDLGRVILETYEDGSTVAYAYDNTGALATVTDSETGIKTTYYYDFLDRLMKYVEKGANFSHSVQYDYDPQNNLSKLVETINGVDHTTEYTYDEDNRVTGSTSNGVSHEVKYDVFGRLSEVTTDNTKVIKGYSYAENSTQISSIQISAGLNSFNERYTYDDNGNIIIVRNLSTGMRTYYNYDSANQLVRENNQAAGKTWTWEYDDAGNIISKKEYNYGNGVLGSPIDTITYAYTDASWGDLLTSYDGVTIQYDAIGNPSYDGNWHFFWKHGRQLEAMVGSNLISFSYDANGMRKTKTVDALTYTYLYNGGQLTQMTRSDGNTLLYTYDVFGHPATVNWNGTVYYIVTNLQGDVVAILDNSNNVIVEYKYDAWGKILSITGSMATTLGTLNPLTYRGYVYDHETGLYYLQSRYYNPEWGRFLNADALVATGQGMLGNNMFAYCRNNPVCRVDKSGTADSYAGWVGEEIGKWLYELITGDDYPTDNCTEITTYHAITTVVDIASAFVNNAEISGGIGLGLAGETILGDAVGVSGGLVYDVCHITATPHSVRFRERFQASFEASFAFLSGGPSYQHFRDYSNNYPNTFYEEESDKTVIFSAGAYLFMGISFELALDVDGFFTEIDHVFGR